MLKKIKDYSIIFQSAKRTRTWLEALQNRYDLWDEDLTCMCGIGSYELYKELKSNKLNPAICFSLGHAFVECSGLLIDVTATQFSRTSKNFKKIEIRPFKTAIKQETFWQVREKATKTKRIKSLFCQWPIRQTHPELLNENNKLTYEQLLESNNNETT